MEQDEAREEMECENMMMHIMDEAVDTYGQLVFWGTSSFNLATGPMMSSSLPDSLYLFSKDYLWIGG